MFMSESKIIEKAIGVLLNGGVIGYPTDTTYGIGCRASDLAAVDKILELKGRDAGKPMSLAFSSVEMIKDYAEVSPSIEKILAEYLPGPYTFLLTKKNTVYDKITAGLPKVGVRIPDFPLILKIIKELNLPIITTSANLSGDPDITRSDDLKLKVDFIIPGVCPIGIPSTLIDLENKRILREGAGLDFAKKIIV